jgi:hypothetical protein
MFHARASFHRYESFFSLSWWGSIKARFLLFFFQFFVDNNENLNSDTWGGVGR